jgi:hypothetical protein
MLLEFGQVEPLQLLAFTFSIDFLPQPTYSATMDLVQGFNAVKILNHGMESEYFLANFRMCIKRPKTLCNTPSYYLGRQPMAWMQS